MFLIMGLIRNELNINISANINNISVGLILALILRRPSCRRFLKLKISKSMKAKRCGKQKKHMSINLFLYISIQNCNYFLLKI